MILVRVGQHDAGDVAPLLHEIADVRQDQVDAGQVLLAGERHADVDDQPGAAPLRRRARRSRDSCRSRRRRRAARTRARCDRPLLIASPPTNTSPAATVCIVPSGKAEHQAARFVDGFELAGKLAIARLDADRLAEPAARASQSARIAAKPAPRFHCARRATIARRQRREQAFGRGADARRGEIGRRIVGAVRMMRAIDADPDRHASCPLALDQDAGELVAVDQQIVRPFQHQPIGAGPGCVRRWRRAAPAPRRTTARASAPAAPDRSAAGSRRDCPAPTPRYGRAGRGPRSGACAMIHSGPRSPSRASAQRLGIGRAERVVSDEPHAGRHRRGIELHQNSDFAAAAAASTSGAG